MIRNVLFSWIDWYIYAVAFYLLFPRLFLRRELFLTSFVDQEPYATYLKIVLYEYHGQISTVIIFSGLILFLFSLKRGFVKY